MASVVLVLFHLKPPPPMAVQFGPAGRRTVASSVVRPAALYTLSVAPCRIGSLAEPGTGGTIWFAAGSVLVDDLNVTLRLLGLAGGPLSSFRARLVVCTSLSGGGVLCGSAGSLPRSSSSRSRKPSSSRSTPMRTPLPGGTHV